MRLQSPSGAPAVDASSALRPSRQLHLTAPAPRPCAPDKRLAFLEWMASPGAAAPALLYSTGMLLGSKEHTRYIQAVVERCGQAYHPQTAPRQRRLVRLAAGQALCQLRAAT